MLESSCWSGREHLCYKKLQTEAGEINLPLEKVEMKIGAMGAIERAKVREHFKAQYIAARNNSTGMY